MSSKVRPHGSGLHAKLLDHVVKPDIVAPGNYLISTLASTSATLRTTQNTIPTNYYNPAGNSSASSAYFKLSGTSMATPVVSGAAALMLQQTSSLTPDQVKARLMKTAYKNFPRTSTATDPTTARLTPASTTYSRLAQVI